ncbi:riboflavin transporter [Erysipelotrichaceae bacterium]|nr:riboflavin transporter [Erysipelotrichaceae bacterium]
MQNSKIKTMVLISLFSALAYVAMLFDFPLPFFPPFLKFDISDVFIFISGIILGPYPMIAVILLKNFLHWMTKGAELGIPIGQLSSILSSLSFTLPAYYFWNKNKDKNNGESKKNNIVALVIGMLSMTVIMLIANYFLILPVYFKLGDIPLPANYLGYVIFTYGPFNLIKSGVVSLLIILVFPTVKNKMSQMK